MTPSFDAPHSSDPLRDKLADAGDPVSPFPPPFPLGGLLALATAGFITVLTEALPAGLLPQMGASLGASASQVGQLVTIYAIGSLLAAIPLTRLTAGWPRRTLLLTAVAGFAIVNTITAVSTIYAVTFAARLFAGVFAGLLWALLAGYATRMVADEHKGRALAVAMAGVPIALCLGIPAGTLLGTLVGWRYAFAIMSVMTIVLIGWVMWTVPRFPGQPAENRIPLVQVLALPGLLAVLVATLTFVLGHNVLYTYIAPFLAHAGMADRIDIVLFTFGAASLPGLAIVGALIDRRLRLILLVSTSAFALAVLILGFQSLGVLSLGVAGSQPTLVQFAVGLWGLAFGGAGTMFQAASAKAAGEAAADTAQSMIVTVWNLAIAGGAFLGGQLLDAAGAGSLPWMVLAILLASLAVSAAPTPSGSRHRDSDSESQSESRDDDAAGDYGARSAEAGSVEAARRAGM